MSVHACIRAICVCDLHGSSVGACWGEHATTVLAQCSSGTTSPFTLSASRTCPSHRWRSLQRGARIWLRRLGQKAMGDGEWMGARSHPNSTFAIPKFKSPPFGMGHDKFMSSTRGGSPTLILPTNTRKAHFAFCNEPFSTKSVVHLRGLSTKPQAESFRTLSRNRYSCPLRRWRALCCVWGARPTHSPTHLDAERKALVLLMAMALLAAITA